VETLRRHLFARAALVALVMSAWFVLNNHCVLGLMEGKAAQTVHAHCHGAKPQQHAPAGDTRECCKYAQIAPLTAKAGVEFDGARFEMLTFAALQVLAARLDESLATAFVFDHGPPGNVSFAESVLQVSLFSHAPPRIA
jgi:hypothetical protein